MGAWMKKQPIVLGIARSGTSMTVEILEALGVEMDSDMPVYHESMEVVKINEAILAETAGYKKHTGRILMWDEIPVSQWGELRVSNKIKKRMENYVKEGVGFKDPRLSLTIHYWLPYLKNPYFICIFRNPIDAVDSWIENFHLPIGLNERFVLLNYMIYLESMTDFIFYNYESLPILTLSYEKCLKDPYGQVLRIANFLGLDSDDDELITKGADVIGLK